MNLDGSPSLCESLGVGAVRTYPAGTVSANRDLADGAGGVLIVYADNLSDVDLRRMLTRAGFRGR